MSKVRPFLKWAGNKYQIIERIKAVLPPGDCLIEPFVGSGAVFMNTDYERYILADNNADLINLYLVLQSEGEPFIDYCRSFFTDTNNREDRYYELREVFNNTSDNRLKSALFIYLIRHDFNGLCRYNSKGGFNAPFGEYSKPYFPEKEMRLFHEKSQKAVFQVADFRDVMRGAEPGSVLYCDPPYVPLSETANFTSYSSGGFTLEDQVDLANLARELAQKGISVVISNHATEFIFNAYQGAEIEKFDVQRYISCDGDNRGKAGEVLALFTGGISA